MNKKRAPKASTDLIKTITYSLTVVTVSFMIKNVEPQTMVTRISQKMRILQLLLFYLGEVTFFWIHSSHDFFRMNFGITTSINIKIDWYYFNMIPVANLPDLWPSLRAE